MTSGSSSVPATGAPPGPGRGSLRHCFVRSFQSRGSRLKAQKDPGATLPGSFLPSRIAHRASQPEADFARSCVLSITSSGRRVSTVDEKGSRPEASRTPEKPVLKRIRRPGRRRGHRRRAAPRRRPRSPRTTFRRRRVFPACGHDHGLTRKCRRGERQRTTGGRGSRAGPPRRPPGHRPPAADRRPPPAAATRRAAPPRGPAGGALRSGGAQGAHGCALRARPGTAPPVRRRRRPPPPRPPPSAGGSPPASSARGWRSPAARSIRRGR